MDSNIRHILKCSSLPISSTPGGKMLKSRLAVEPDYGIRRMKPETSALPCDGGCWNIYILTR